MKWIFRIIGGIIIIPFIMFLFLYFKKFYPSLNTLKFIIKNEEGKLSNIQNLYELAVLAEGKNNLRFQATRNTYYLVIHTKKSHTHKEWHVNTSLWYFSSYLHFNEREIFYLWSATTYAGKQGLQNSSLFIFNKELSTLSLIEKAQLIAMIKAPIHYKLGTSKLIERTNQLIHSLSLIEQ